MACIEVSAFLKLRAEMGTKLLAVDVRDTDYDVGGHFDGAINIQAADVIAAEIEAMAVFKPYGTIVVYCMCSMQRAVKASEAIRKAYPRKTVLVLTGGFKALQSAPEASPFIVPPPK